MAKNKVKLELTPVMSLSIMAIFFMTFTMVSLSNSQRKANASRAANVQPVVQEMEPEITPSPEPLYQR